MGDGDAAADNQAHHLRGFAHHARVEPLYHDAGHGGKPSQPSGARGRGSAARRPPVNASRWPAGAAAPRTTSRTAAAAVRLMARLAAHGRLPSGAVAAPRRGPAAVLPPDRRMTPERSCDVPT